MCIRIYVNGKRRRREREKQKKKLSVSGVKCPCATLLLWRKRQNKRKEAGTVKGVPQYLHAQSAYIYTPQTAVLWWWRRTEKNSHSTGDNRAERQNTRSGDTTNSSHAVPSSQTWCVIYINAKKWDDPHHPPSVRAKKIRRCEEEEEEEKKCVVSCYVVNLDPSKGFLWHDGLAGDHWHNNQWQSSKVVLHYNRVKHCPILGREGR